ncbi:hypothetical protein PCANC_13860 [Puccinia coronata f. sp. avenae]|uniref:RRM domain-containing protein n=1 Tax=Puccinia coronata f. sp. avenae TaxID=200324 RepID=A0A2N5TGF6_9BASI|nr:hypothetical protein PCANC_26882 [Puccinia coronata f. sp. avenae]PLW24585.1 hypothetical protein PCASD_06177 [Puccinia coronata f. sp. avenae]PLW40927.1 hypothetical protein PCANC_13860 [Puccinia coronata f. sp. avenae]PLW50485.1 hypothetical protein PCASD_01385 [Puccinia coronata f. sp. avenae]
MASVMGYGHGAPGFAGQGLNRAALAAAAHSVQSHRVYVGNLPYAVGWKELKDFMREAGEVSFAEVLMRDDGRSKGCGVVEFSSEEAAQKAIAELSDRTLLGRPVFIREDRETQPRFGHQPQRPSHPVHPGAGYSHAGGSGVSGRQLFITGLAPSVTWHTLKDTFRTAGTVVRADVNVSKCTGTVLMSSEAEATAAISAFNGTMIEGSQVVVREDRFTQTRQGGYPAQSGYGAAASRPAPVDPANQQPSQQLFVNNLPYSTDSAALLALSPSAINAEVMMMGGRSKGMGVLEYPSLESSAEALASLQGQMMGGRPIMVKYNERWHDFSEQAVSASSS